MSRALIALLALASTSAFAAGSLEQRIRMSYHSGEETVLSGDRTELAVYCPVGQVATGGGVDCQFASDYTIERSQWNQEQGPNVGTGWIVWIQGGSGSCWAKVACIAQ